MTISKTTTHADGEAVPRWAADLLADAHAGMQLWRLCEHRDCRRRRACRGKADPCGMYLAPKAWAWVREAVTALREGASPRLAAWAADLAEPRKRRTIVGKEYSGRPIVLAAEDDGVMVPLEGPLRPTPWALQLRRLVGPRGAWLRGEL
jgi:hypothetical protein